jgi:hypothetical protein
VLQTHLRLSRAQCAYLHRELATALKQAPLDVEASRATDLATLQAENADLRHRLATLQRHYTDLQHRHEAYVDSRVSEALFAEAQPALGDALMRLLALAHPDRWSQGQPASALAHELVLTINRMREELEVQP